MKLERVLVNLISNAIKFTKEGYVGIEAKVDGETLRITVSDTGIGINERDLGRIFEEFYQVHNRERNSDKGYGLGLAIANQLARQIGGQLSVESQPDRGSRFSILLPRDSFLATTVHANGRNEYQPVADQAATITHH
jgi:signal transduction histidine kinase